MIKIALAEDHGVVRAGLRILLSAEPDLEVVGEAADGPSVLPMVQRVGPHVLLLDLMLPGKSGLEVTREVTTACPATRVVILSMHAESAYVVEAIRHGALGYVVKDCTGPELVAAIHEVAAGRSFVSKPFAARTLES